MKATKTWQAILAGSRGIRFDDAIRCAEAFGYRLVRTAGSHRILKHPDVPELLNLQPRPDGTAKAYQLRQLVGYVERYGLRMGR
jgi:predicted RNA binding protein YcfA (HicA-like mRNA interferase family)